MLAKLGSSKATLNGQITNWLIQDEAVVKDLLKCGETVESSIGRAVFQTKGYLELEVLAVADCGF